MQTENKKWMIGLCAMDTKARSKPMRNILDRLLSTGDFEVTIFGDKVILDEAIEHWPLCDFLISFFSSDFPLEKAIKYAELRKPMCLNDIPMQQLLWDRRLVLALLDAIGVPTPKRLVSWNNDCPPLPSIVKRRAKKLGVDIQALKNKVINPVVTDSETIKVGNDTLVKPFVEKPVSGEDHNIYIYYHSKDGGGIRKLFRKKGNKSSEYFPGVTDLRYNGKDSYIYEEFMSVDNAEDVKVYTIGPGYSHAETRKSPVVDGMVRRNADGKEIRYVTELTPEEQEIASKICQVFGQTICGFDLLRANGRSYVIDVNGWSFVKGNNDYYDRCAEIIRKIFLDEVLKRGPTLVKKPISSENQWRLKSFMAVMRHGDRTPKQKVKYTFASEPFMKLVRTSEEEIVYKKAEQFEIVINTIKEAIKNQTENLQQLDQIYNILEAKGKLEGTKVQLRPLFSKNPKTLDKMQLIIKWGGVFTHAGTHHSEDLGANLRTDLNIINKELIQDVQIWSSSERRVIETSLAFCKTFLQDNTFDQSRIVINKEMLDDSNAAKEQTDIVKAKLQMILNPEHHAKPPSEFVMPANWVDLSEPVQELIDLLKRIRNIMIENLKIPKQTETVWCCYETPFLFRERWEKLFRDFCDVERTKFEPSKISELYDALKFDLLHNRDYLVYAFHHETENLIPTLCAKSKALFDVIGPHEYGIDNQEKLDIGFKNTHILLTHILKELLSSRDSAPFSRLYFTKESKVYCLLNVVLICGLKTKFIPTDVSELDYLTQITFELYERSAGSGENDRSEPEYSLRIGFSPGAHDPNLVDTQLDNNHALSVAPRRWLTEHIPLDEALVCFGPAGIAAQEND
ncbi:histidine phosphatase superfamily-domain-containing protein [Globomyces pollinis-pini]|nr:histidine phosphatase superfamily-domain-containing protein [Globomyces pollinis-pini]